MEVFLFVWPGFVCLFVFRFFSVLLYLSKTGLKKRKPRPLYCIGSEFAPPSGRFENDENTDASLKELFFFHSASVNIVLFVPKPRAPVSFS